MRKLHARPTRIKAKDAKEMIGQDGVKLVDVRTPPEYAMGHIGGAVLLPLDMLTEKVQSALPDKDARVIVYCQSGARSAFAAGQLAAMGYGNVHDLGGIVRWPYGITRG